LRVRKPVEDKLTVDGAIRCLEMQVSDSRMRRRGSPTLSIKQRIKYDDPESARDIPAFPSHLNGSQRLRENVHKIVPIGSPAFGRVMAVCIGASMVGSIHTAVKEGEHIKRGLEFG